MILGTHSKYLRELAELRNKTRARGAVIIIIDGNKGHGCAMQFEDLSDMAGLPEALEAIAQKMRLDIQTLTEPKS